MSARRAREEDEPRDEQPADSDPEPHAPAGNAVYDPEQQTQRADVDPSDEEVDVNGEILRGSAPSTAPDDSHQPHRDDHRSNQDWGSASQSGKRQGA